VPDGNRIADDAAAAVEADAPAFKGAGMLQDAVDLGERVSSGDWTEGLASLASAGYETAELLRDPIAKLASMGLGWVIEAFAPFRSLLDALTGDQQRLATLVGTWSGIADELHGAAQDLHDRYTKDTAGWTGDAVEQYRRFCADRVDLYHAAGATARSTADNVGLSRSVLAVVREVVRGLVSDAVGTAISIVCRYPPPATPAAAGELGALVSRTGGLVREWLTKLQRAFANAAQLMKDGGNLFRDVREALVHLNKLGRMSMRSGRHVEWLATTATGMGKHAKNVVREATGDLGEQAAEKIAIESGKEAVNASAEYAKRPDEPGDPSRLYEGPGPHRVSGTL
jgi:hypothetical protein